MKIVAVLILILLISINAISKIGFWRAQKPYLDFVTAPQSVYGGACSGATTIQTKTASGVVMNVTADTVVNISTSGDATFYSDMACSTSISSITITNGSNSNSFYFILSTTGSETFSVSADNYKSDSQVETFVTNPYVWAGSGGNNLWTTGANWSGGTAPGPTHQALFNGTCSVNCSPSIQSNVSVAGVRIVSGYGGTITQTSGFSITVGSVGWVQSAGAFVGSPGTTASDNISISTIIKISAGSFQTTASTLQVQNFEISGAGSFNANNGTLFATSGNCYLTSGSGTFNNVTVNCGYVNLNGSTMNVAGTLTLHGGYNAYLMNGTILASGNVVSKTGSGYPNIGTLFLKLVGNASGQTVTGEGGSGIPNLEIDTGANNATLTGTITITGLWGGSVYKVTSVGTLTTTGSTLTFSNSSNIFPSTAFYNNVVFDGNADFNGNTMNINGTTSLLGAYNRPLVNGIINCYGNITASTASGYGLYGTAVIVAKGNVAGQTITSTSAGATIPNLEINAGIHDVTLSGGVSVWGAMTVTSVGILNVAGSTLRLTSAGIFNSGGKNFESVEISAATSLLINSLTVNSATTVATGGSLNMAGLSVTTNSMVLNSTTVTKNGGVLTVGGTPIGTGSFFGGTIAP